MVEVEMPQSTFACEATFAARFSADRQSGGLGRSTRPYREASGTRVWYAPRGSPDHVSGLTDVPQRIPPGDALEDVGIHFCSLLPGRRSQGARSDRVHANTGRSVANSEAPRQVA